MKCGKARNTPQQKLKMQEWFHGSKHRPAQIKLLTEANINYRDLYDEIQSAAIEKSDNISSVVKYKLKSSITLNIERNYISGSDINQADLEKQYRSGNQILSGRSLLEMAQKGVKCYKKTLA